MLYMGLILVENSVCWRCKSMIENPKDVTCEFGYG